MEKDFKGKCRAALTTPARDSNPTTSATPGDRCLPPYQSDTAPGHVICPNHLITRLGEECRSERDRLR